MNVGQYTDALMRFNNLRHDFKTSKHNDILYMWFKTFNERGSKLNGLSSCDHVP